MVIRKVDRTVAARMFHVAVGIVVMRDDDVAVRRLAIAAVENPSPETVRDLLAVSIGKPWRESVIDALAECGVVAIGDVMRGHE